MSAGMIDRAERDADAVWGEAPPGSQIEQLAGALRDLAAVVRRLLDTVEANRGTFDEIRQTVSELERKTDSPSGTLSVYE